MTAIENSKVIGAHEADPVPNTVSGISVEEVVWCYRLLLGRDPESAEAIQLHQMSKGRADLVGRFMNSDEFMSRSPIWHKIDYMLGRFGSLPVKVDVVVTPAQLVKLLLRVKECWARLGISRPYWSVLSGDQFMPDRIGESIDEFWESGRRDAERLSAILNRIQYNASKRRTFIEYGCGVGRMTGSLAAKFGHVHAYDISPGHLNLARARVKDLGLKNVSFHLASENPLDPLEKCDVYFSTLVLQHNPPPLIKQLVNEALRSLRPNGVAVFQLTTYASGYQFNIDDYLSQPPPPNGGFEVHCLPQAEIFDLAAKNQCRILEVHEDGAAGSPERCVSNLFVMRKQQNVATAFR